MFPLPGGFPAVVAAQGFQRGDAAEPAGRQPCGEKYRTQSGKQCGQHYQRMQPEHRGLAAGQVGGHPVDHCQNAAAGGKPQHGAQHKGEQRNRKGFFQQAAAQLPGGGADTGQDAQLMAPGLHGDLKGVVQQQDQSQGCGGPYRQQKRQQQRRRIVPGIGDEIPGQQGLMDLDLLLRQAKCGPDLLRFSVYGAFIPKGQFDHRFLRSG